MKNKNICLICNTIFFEDDEENSCPNCGSTMIEAHEFDIYEDDEDNDSEGGILA